ncbi:MAG: hypothetical protein JXA77_13555 [Bacteroidales bacterium]|nr:hypothetical protein [Bacteroidales bacterium]
MKEKVLISEGRDKAEAFTKDVNEVLEGCNSLINIFHEFQDLTHITTEEEFIELVTDPKEYLDRFLIAAVDLRTTGKAKIDPEQLARLLSIDRDNYLNLVAGIPVTEDCEPCRKVKKVRRGQLAIDLHNYQEYSSYLVFNSGIFTKNIPAIEEKKKSFRVYADSPEALQLVEHYENLCQTLNNAIEVHRLGQSHIKTLAGMFRLLVLGNKLVINNFMIAEQIKNRKYENVHGY